MNITDAVLNRIQPLPQTQATMQDQVASLHWVANRLGLYDAADFIRNRTARINGGQFKMLVGKEALADVPHCQQAQGATNDQIRALIPVANRLGLRDAADYFRIVLEDAR
jgi:hypothetical protein